MPRHAGLEQSPLQLAYLLDRLKFDSGRWWSERSVCRSDLFPASPDSIVEPNTVYIWNASLLRPAAQIRCFEHMLSAEERDRSERFRHALDRERFIIARGQLRSTLAIYLGILPAEIVFCYNPHGKPALAAPYHSSTLQFNISHSQDWCTIAVVRDRAVGVDIEYIAGDIDYFRTAERFFAPQVAQAIRHSALADQRTMFFRYWTRREALTKALGGGLTESLRRYEFAANCMRAGSICV